MTYVDVDRRAERFFEDAGGVSQLLVDPDVHAVRFIPADYTDDLDIAECSFDLLVSLYAASSPSTALATSGWAGSSW